MQPNLAAGTTTNALLGVTSTTNNCGLLSYGYVGPGSASNFISLGLFGQSTNNPPFFVNGSGLVGVGTSNPSYTLDVTGSIRATGALLGSYSSISGTISAGALAIQNSASVGGYLSVAKNASIGGTLTTTYARVLGPSYIPTDSSANGYATPTSGAVTTTSSSPYSDPAYGCLSFPGGTLSYIDYNNASYPNTHFDWGVQDFTAECWLYTAALPTAGWVLFGCGNVFGGTNDWSLNISPAGKAWLYYYGTGSVQTITTAQSITLNAWNHVALSYVNSSATITVYLNGVGTVAAKTGTQVYSGGSDFIMGGMTLITPTGGGSYTTSNSGLGPAQLTDVRVLKGVAAYTGSTLIVPTSPFRQQPTRCSCCGPSCRALTRRRATSASTR
jgi:hypothetical protein